MTDKCSERDWKKTCFNGGNTIQAGGLSYFLKNWGKTSVKASKKLASKLLRNSGHASEIETKIGTAPLFKNPKAALTTFPDVMIFCHTSKELLFEKLV